MVSYSRLLCFIQVSKCVIRRIGLLALLGQEVITDRRRGRADD